MKELLKKMFSGGCPKICSAHVAPGVKIEGQVWPKVHH